MVKTIRLLTASLALLSIGAAQAGANTAVRPKDQRQIANVCIIALYKTDVSFVRVVLANAGFKGIEMCTDKIESDTMATVIRLKYPDDRFTIRVVVDRNEDAGSTRIYDRLSVGTFRPGESHEDAVQRVLSRDRNIYVRRLKELRQKFQDKYHW